MYDIKLIGIKKLSDITRTPVGIIGNLFGAINTAIYNEGGYTGIFKYLGQAIISAKQNTESGTTISKTLKTILNNLAIQVGGHDGLFSPMITKYISSDLSVLETGEIPNVPLDDNPLKRKLLRSRTTLVDDNYFKAKLSRSGTRLIKELRDMNSNMIEVNKFLHVIDDENLQETTSYDSMQLISLILNKMGSSVDSIIVDAMKSEQIEIVQVKQIKIIIAEVMNLYHELYKFFIKKQMEINLSEKDIDGLVENITYVISRLESKEELPINTISELRKLNQNIRQIRVITELFTS